MATAKKPAEASGDYVKDPIHGIVPKDAETHRKLYLKSLTDDKTVSPTDGAPAAVENKLNP